MTVKYSLLCLFTSFALVGTTFAQKRKNAFDTTLSKKHELAVAIGVTSHSLFPGPPNGMEGRGASLNIEYARVYKHNHFLRTGLRLATVGQQQRYEFGMPASPNIVDPSIPGPSFPPTDQISDESIRREEFNNNYLSAFVGYEYGVGHKRFRFTFGVDLNFGYNRRRVSAEESWYTVNRTYDPITNFFHYDMQGIRAGHMSGFSDNLFLSITPRLGIRRDLGRRIALALTFTPQIGYSNRLAYSEVVVGDRPVMYYHPKSAWFAGANADLRLIIKLGKN